MKTEFNHCKNQYNVIQDYSDLTNIEVILFKGVEYKIERLPRPCKNETDLRVVIVNGVKYSSFAKFLKLN